MTVIREGYSSFGRCWIEDHGSYFMVFTMNGKSQNGPYSTLSAALEYFCKFCP